MREMSKSDVVSSASAHGRSFLAVGDKGQADIDDGIKPTGFGLCTDVDIYHGVFGGTPQLLQLLRAAVGRVSRASRVHTGMRNSIRDEGGPFGLGDQEPIPNHCKLLRPKAVVVSVAAKVRTEVRPVCDRGRRAQANHR
jgi:hypothetical protein